MQIVALIHEEGGRFGVSFPDFPGATTVAGSADAAITKAAEALAFHLEGLAEDGSLPQPRTLEQLQTDAHFRVDAAGAMVALIPYAPPSQIVRVNITIDESLLGRIDRVAELSGQTRSGWLTDAAKTRLGAAVSEFSESQRSFGESAQARFTRHKPSSKRLKRKSARSKVRNAKRSRR